MLTPDKIWSVNKPVSELVGTTLADPLAAERFARKALMPTRFRLIGPRRSFAAGGLYTQSGPLSLAYMWSRGHYVADQMEADTSRQDLLITWCIEGGMEIGAGHSSVTAGELVIIPCGGQIAFHFAAPVATLSIRLPGSTAMQSLGGPAGNALCYQPINSKGGSGAVVRDVLLSAWQHRRSIDHNVADVMLESIGRLLNATAENRHKNNRGLTLSRQSALLDVRAYVVKNLGNREAMKPALLSKYLGRSTRSLQAALREAGTTLQRLILVERLDAASRQIRSAVCNDRSISEIAFSVGFENLAHFSRQFKARFKTCPQRYRTTAGAH